MVLSLVMLDVVVTRLLLRRARPEVAVTMGMFIPGRVERALVGPYVVTEMGGSFAV